METGQCLTRNCIIRWKLECFTFECCSAGDLSVVWHAVKEQYAVSAKADYWQLCRVGGKGFFGDCDALFPSTETLSPYGSFGPGPGKGVRWTESPGPLPCSHSSELSGFCFKDPAFEFDPSDVKPLSVLLPYFLKWFSWQGVGVRGCRVAKGMKLMVIWGEGVDVKRLKA